MGGFFIGMVLWVALSVMVGSYAQGKGRSFGAFVVLGLVTSPVIAWIVALVSAPGEETVRQQAVQHGTRRECPHCFELVDPRATACPQCQRDIEPIASKEALECANCGRPLATGTTVCEACEMPPQDDSLEAVVASHDWEEGMCTRCGSSIVSAHRDAFACPIPEPGGAA